MHAKTRDQEVADFAHATWATGDILLDLVRQALRQGFKQSEIDLCRAIWIANESMKNNDRNQAIHCAGFLWESPTMERVINSSYLDRTASTLVRRRGWL